MAGLKMCLGGLWYSVVTEFTGVVKLYRQNQEQGSPGKRLLKAEYVPSRTLFVGNLIPRVIC